MKSEKDEPKKEANHNWQKQIIVKKEYPCEICKEKIEVGAKAKYRVKEDNIVVHAHVECTKKGKGLTAMSEKEHAAAVKEARDETCGGCSEKDKCKKDCEIVDEAIAAVGIVQ